MLSDVENPNFLARNKLFVMSNWRQVAVSEKRKVYHENTFPF